MFVMKRHLSFKYGALSDNLFYTYAQMSLNISINQNKIQLKFFNLPFLKASSIPTIIITCSDPGITKLILFICNIKLINYKTTIGYFPMKTLLSLQRQSLMPILTILTLKILLFPISSIPPFLHYLLNFFFFYFK